MRFLAALIALTAFASSALSQGHQPNVIYLMADELAYYELSHMGNFRIKTPNADRFASEGIRFTKALAASPVCAPLRCNLMTGKHAGNASVRANDGGTPYGRTRSPLPPFSRNKATLPGASANGGAVEETPPEFPKSTALASSSVITTRFMRTAFIHPTSSATARKFLCPEITADARDRPTPSIRSSKKPSDSFGRTARSPSFATSPSRHLTACSAYLPTNPLGNSTKRKRG